MTNNIAYIGSQNFSDPSSSNFEGGLLIKDNMAIEELDKYVKNFLIDKSEQYYEDKYYETKILVSSMLRNLDLERETLFSQAYDLSGHRGDESFYYNQYHDCYNFSTLETLKSIFD